MSSLIISLEDLRECKGVKIKSSLNTCYLQRYDLANGYYWAECKLIGSRVKELAEIEETNLLNTINNNMNNYLLFK